MYERAVSEFKIKTRDTDSAGTILNTGRLTMGDTVAEFEQKIAQYLGIRFFVMVNSCSCANLVILWAMLRQSKVEPFLSSRNGVSVPAVAWPATIWVIFQLGLTPIIKVMTFWIYRLVGSISLRCKIPFDRGLEI